MAAVEPRPQSFWIYEVDGIKKRQIAGTRTHMVSPTVVRSGKQERLLFRQLMDAGAAILMIESNSTISDQRMNRRHAIWVALIGWYLLVPPLVNAPYKVDTEAPLSNWKVYRTFTTAEECKKFWSASQTEYQHTANAPIGSIKKGTRAFALQMSFARCIASDSPALAK
ncbi:MAG: hypothetical protein JO266_12515 [Acidobacteria bacterium]|nr:hypothetical protein [Acidobacteriota bacterium]